jgi:hypothetical protein
MEIEVGGSPTLSVSPLQLVPAGSSLLIIRTISVVLGLGILIGIPCLAGMVCSSVGRDNPIVTFGASSRQKV